MRTSGEEKEERGDGAGAAAVGPAGKVMPAKGLLAVVVGVGVAVGKGKATEDGAGEGVWMGTTWGKRVGEETGVCEWIVVGEPMVLTKLKEGMEADCKWPSGAAVVGPAVGVGATP